MVNQQYKFYIFLLSQVSRYLGIKVEGKKPSYLKAIKQSKASQGKKKTSFLINP
jgi:hypothetical protein